MLSICRGIRAISIILFVAIATSFCASKNFLVVNYKLPVEPEIPAEDSVSLVFKDYREDPSTVTKSAKKALKDFSGNFTLIVSQENKNDRLAGAFSLHSMIRQIFKSRLENAGIRVASEGESRETVVEIILKVFKLDLVGRKLGLPERRLDPPQPGHRRSDSREPSAPSRLLSVGRRERRLRRQRRSHQRRPPAPPPGR